jgi:hypothetical protein
MTADPSWFTALGSIIVPIVVSLGGLMLTLHGANIRRYEHLHECLHRLDGRIIRLETRLSFEKKDDAPPSGA